MTLLEDVKAAVERTTGWRRPSAEQLARLLAIPADRDIAVS